ncbi:flagellar hook-length control protein FliK [Campylobacter mucosalis]|uniref:flagellar hook-length control protein FliK n=1 Tax=Campylobacter mucosalis TaxID=202 RepID=UPI0004D9D025|nr:flagellar hook-length control protein FliK [Campylobacter mucosalis]KEA45514.1 flagellar hook-length control protein FliK [Campylobacter mucosalis]QKF63316.1 proximal flagellar hook-filament junction protein FlgK [Campylobacter mucosalis]
MDIASLNSQGINQTSIQSGSTPKQQGAIFKNQPPQQNISEQRVNDAIDSVDRLLNRVMNELGSSGGKTATIIEQAKDAKIAPNLANDLQALAKALDSSDEVAQNPALKELSLKLKEFLKPIADLKTIPLNEQIKSSGVMLEANLKEALNPQKFPASVQKLLSDIKNLSNQNLLNQIINLANDTTLDTKSSFFKLNEILQNEKANSIQILNSSSAKLLLLGVDKLDNMSKFLDKLNFNLSEKSANITPDSIKTQTSKISELISNLKQNLQNVSNEKLNQSSGFSANLKDFTKIAKGVEEALGRLNNVGNETDLIKAYTGLISKDSSDGSLQEKLSSAARRLAQTLNFIDQTASSAKSNLDELKLLTKQLNVATNDASSIETKSSSEISKTLNSDIKSTLLSLQDKANSLNNAQQISQMATKMLSQIELHQIVSSLSGGVQTYLPYVWDEVDDTKVAFKRGKKDKYYAQIDLNFKQYGQINILASLSDKRYIDVSIATAQKDFKDLIIANQKELKQAISAIGLMVSGFSIKVMPKNEIKERFKDFDGLEMGYDVRA